MALPANPNADMFNKTWASIVAAQKFNATDATGHVNTYSFHMLDAYMAYVGKTLIISGLSIGMTFVLIVVLLLLTRPEKRRTPVFVLNLVALFVQFLRMILSAAWWNSPAEDISTTFLDINVLASNANLWIINLFAIFSMVWYFVILTSMVLQVRVVFAAERKLQKLVTAALALLGLATFGVDLPTQIQSIISVSNKTGIFPSWYIVLEHDAHILWAVTIGVSSLIFVSKLLYLIHKRKRLGFKGFGPLQIITIMGAQCLIIPLIFVVLDFYVNVNGFVTIGETLLTCTLPLSALWASFKATNAAPAQGVPSIGPLGTSSSAGAAVEVAPSSKRSFFRKWRGTSNGSYSDDRSDMEKGSFSEESDHVMVQKTLHVVSSESAVPGSGRGNHQF